VKNVAFSLRKLLLFPAVGGIRHSTFKMQNIVNPAPSGTKGEGFSPAEIKNKANHKDHAVINCSISGSFFNGKRRTI